MIFTEFRFFIFFAIVFAIYWALRSNSWRKAWILACSYAFYGAWDWRFLSLIIGSTLVDYVVGLNLGKTESPKARRGWLMVSLLVNLGALAFFQICQLFCCLSRWVLWLDWATGKLGDAEHCAARRY